MRISLLSFLFLFFVSCLSAQERSTIALVEFFTPSNQEIRKANPSNSPFISIGESTHKKVASNIRKLEGYVADALVADQRFTVIERRQIEFIEAESELQKSEDFIDGYIVGQGKKTGAEYLLLGDVDAKCELLSLSLFDVGNQTTSHKKSIDLKGLQTYPSKIRTRVMSGTQALLFEVLPPKILIVKQLSGNSKKVNSLLISGGRKYGLQKGQQMLIKIKEVETIEGEQFERLKTVGEITIEEVENENFSKCTVDEGNKEVKVYLDAGTKLYCFPKQ